MDKPNLRDAVRTGVGKSKEVVIWHGLCLYWWIDRAAVGEKIARGINHAQNKPS
jgi:hypothetical protein